MSRTPTSGHPSHQSLYTDHSQQESSYRIYTNLGCHASGQGIININPQTTNYQYGRSNFHLSCTALKLLCKIDLNIVPFLALIYLLSFLSPTNVRTLVRLTGFQGSLEMMKDLDYSVALAVFFPLYAAAAVPSNIMMKRTSPSLWLCIITVACGVCMTAMNFIKDFRSLLIAQMALGLAEGGLFPGVAWYITLWYRRHECGLRMAIVFSVATLADALSGLLALAISHMDGIGGRSSWAWVFILEGLPTIVVALFAKLLVADSPETAKFLTEEERQEVNTRLKHDRAALADEFTTKFLFDALKDWKIYVHMLITIGIYTPLYSISLFLPIIVKNMGYSYFESQLMSVPPYGLGCVATITGGFLADRSKKRGLYMITFCLIAIVGFAMLISTHEPHFQYIGTFLVVSGIYPNVPLGVAWNGNNIGGATKRAVGIAMHIGFGNLGGVIANFSFRFQDAPRYFFGYGVLIGMVTMSLILCVFMHTYLMRENARRDAAITASGLTLDSYTEEYADSERGKGDNATFFRYTE